MRKKSQEKDSKDNESVEKAEEATAAKGDIDAPAKEALAKDPAAEGIFKRRKILTACVESLNYVQSISQDEGVKVRDSDRATSLTLLICSLLTVAAMLFEPLAPHRLPLLLTCDLLIGVTIFAYLGHRFGILTTFSPRQALLAWQLMLGSTFFGIFITINLALLLGIIVVALTPVETPIF
ncbi:MAG: hypothetical protein K8F91_17950 [Candidatus Obscuribacterales bacterium]|nr:hypothetical protein [Candidatus Obscuribacterales bacterium]